MAARVIAHRGARSLAPENTLQAAAAGLNAGADLWETDVNVTADGHLILFHDETLNRCTNVLKKYPGQGPALVRDFSLARIRNLEAGSFFFRTDPFGTIAQGLVQQPAPEKKYNEFAIPLLEEGLAWTLENGWKINLELKYFPDGRADTFLPDRVVKVISAMGFPPEKVVISSFYHPWLLHIRETAPEIEVQALLGDRMDVPLDFGEYVFDTYNLNAAMVDGRLISKLKSMDRQVNLFTVNDPELFARFERMGVDGIFTDFPQLFSRSERGADED